MANDISSGGNSEFLATRKLFRAGSSNAKEEIFVYVEDELDIIFWRHFFAKYETNKLFKIIVLRHDDNELCGKDPLIKYIKLDSLGRNKIIAIDSDYDYIIDDYHLYTQELRECKYVIHTNDTYSIENYKIVPSLLKEAIYLTSFCDYISEEDIEKIMLETSQVLYDLFTIHLFSIHKKDNIYKISDFASDLNKLTYKNSTISEHTHTYISQRINSFKSYIDSNRIEYDTFLIQLETKGVKNYNCWQFMRGHNVFDEIGIKIALGIASKYRGEYFKWLYSSIADETHRNNLISKYNNSTRVEDGKHKLKDRIREILYDIKPDFTWEPSVNINNQIAIIFDN